MVLNFSRHIPHDKNIIMLGLRNIQKNYLNTGTPYKMILYTHKLESIGGK
jgi:hypothetical protein